MYPGDTLALPCYMVNDAHPPWGKKQHGTLFRNHGNCANSLLLPEAESADAPSEPTTHAQSQRSKNRNGTICNKTMLEGSAELTFASQQ